MYGPSLDEGALTWMHQIIEYKSKPTGKTFGNKLSKAVHKADRAVVTDLLGFILLY